MFFDGKFKELKGAQFDRNLKSRFINFFSQKEEFQRLKDVSILKFIFEFSK